MPFCPVCRCEYLLHVLICPECNVPLVPELPPDEPEHYPESSVEVFQTEDHLQLVMARGLLEENGIGCILGDREADPFRLRSAGLSLRVSESDADRARELIDTYLIPGETKFICESCGAELDELADTCPRCGKSPTS